MPNGYESFSELGRVFDDFRLETRDELKFLRRLLIGTLTSVILASVVTSAFIALRGGP